MTNKHPWLITIDLDGTLLSDPIEGQYPNTNYNKYNSQIIKKAIEKGHKIAIVTGRPWRDTEKIYRDLDLRTIVANYNGANIHHPHDEIFKPINFGINRKFFKQIIQNKNLKKAMDNFVVEGPSCTQVLNLDDDYMLKQFHIDKNSKDVLQCDLNVELRENPQSFIFKINEKKIDKMN